MKDPNVCQVCKTPMLVEHDRDEQKAAMPDTSSLPWSPKGWDGDNICSIKCQENAIRMNACWALKNNLRNMQNGTFENFNKVFKFPEAGGYAMDKYEKMRCNPWLFVLGLDVDNFLAIVIKQ